MKRLVALLILISHMNTSMLLPQVPQHDVFDEHGNQVDDINSVVVYVLVTLGLDDVADDEANLKVFPAGSFSRAKPFSV